MSGTRRRSLLDWKALVGIALGVILLWFALRDVHLAEVLLEIRRADPLLFAASVFAATFVFVVRAWRWRPLLTPFNPGTRFRPRFAATSIGFMANNLLPARVGEFARAYVLSRMERVPAVASFGSLVVERLLDGVTVVGFLFLAIAAPNFPLDAVRGRDFGGTAAALLAIFIAAVAMLVLMVYFSDPAVRLFRATVARLLPGRIRTATVAAFATFLSGLAVLRSPALLVRAALWSLAVWLVNALSFWLGFLAFDIQLPFTAAVFLQSVIALAVALPSAPGFFGLWEAGARIGLVDVYGVTLNKALGFAIGFHMGGFVPITVIGLYYVWRLGLSWREVERSEDVVEDEAERPPPGGGRAASDRAAGSDPGGHAESSSELPTARP